MIVLPVSVVMTMTIGPTAIIPGMRMTTVIIVLAVPAVMIGTIGLIVPTVLTVAIGMTGPTGVLTAVVLTAMPMKMLITSIVKVVRKERPVPAAVFAATSILSTRINFGISQFSNLELNNVE